MNKNIIIKEYLIDKTVNPKDTSNLYDIPVIEGYRLLGCNLEYITCTSNMIVVSVPIRIYLVDAYRLVVYNFSSSSNTLKGSIFAMFIKTINP